MEAAAGFEEFVAIVDAGSITGAADALGLPRPTVSQRLARLEHRLGVRLLHRTTRRMSLTQPGRLLYARASRIVAAARQAEAEVRRLDNIPRGLLRISVPASTSASVMATWIEAFRARYPEVSLELVAASERVDLIGDGFDLALRRGEIAEASLIARTLLFDESIAVASPEYLRKNGTPRTPADLVDHMCISWAGSGHSLGHRWPQRDGGSVPISASLCTNVAELRLEGAQRGLGIGLVSRYQAAPRLADGTLVPVLPDEIGQREPVSLVYIDREFLDPKIRAFVDFLVAWVEQRERSAG